MSRASRALLPILILAVPACGAPRPAEVEISLALGAGVERASVRGLDARIDGAWRQLASSTVVLQAASGARPPQHLYRVQLRAGGQLTALRLQLGEGQGAPRMAEAALDHALPPCAAAHISLALEHAPGLMKPGSKGAERLRVLVAQSQPGECRDEIDGGARPDLRLASSDLSSARDAADPACQNVVCPPGQVCQAGQCVMSDPCAMVVCAPGQVCQAGQCVVAPDLGAPRDMASLPDLGKTDCKAHAPR